MDTRCALFKAICTYEEVLEVCDAANNVSRLTRDFNDVRKKFTDIS